MPEGRSSGLRRMLPRVRRSGRRLADPVTGVPLRAAVVADVDLDTGTVDVVEPVTPFEHPPEGVHALVWWHGRPLGEVTVMGQPDDVLADLPGKARRELCLQLAQHALEDALAHPDGLDLARTRGLAAIPHPESDPAPDPPSVTVAVCTRDRPDGLRACLTAVRALRGPVAEVLVVDNAGRDDATRRVVDEFPGVRYVYEPRPGLDWARNRALLEATSDVVAYTDDDVRVHPGWVEGLRTAFQEEPAAVAVTGLVVPAELATPAQVLFEVVGGFGRGFRRKWFAAAVEQGEVASAVFGGSGTAGTGANMAYRRERLLELGGFDPALDVGTPTGGGGDLEAFFRVVAAGDLLVYEPSAVVRHVHRPDMEQLLGQMRGHGTGSFSYFLGAGRHYGPSQARSFHRLTLWWLRHGHLRPWGRSVLAPELMPLAVRRAETRGALDAVVHRYYRRAEQRAAAIAATHDDEPTTPPLVRTPARPRPTREPDPVVDVDLDRLPVVSPLGSTRTGRRVRVRVLRGGELQHVFAIRTRGAPLTTARLRRELVDELGAALLEPGLTWNGWSGVRLDGQPVPAVVKPPDLPGLSAAQVDTVQRLLDGTPLDRPAGGLAVQSVSALVCTRDRPDRLRTCLQALTRQSPDLQVVVVDNSADPSTTFEIAAGFPSVVVAHEPQAGLSRARNTGLPLCTGEVVGFVDDDVEPAPNWLDRLLAPFADPDVWAVTGAVLPKNVDELEAQVFEDYGGLYRGPHRAVFTPGWLAVHRRAVPTWRIGATANAAIRRSTLEALGPFVETLGAGRPAGVGEDTEYFYRVLRAGGQIAYEPTAVVLHAHRGTRDELARQLHDYAAGHVAYHLELAARYRDLRGLPRIAVEIPRYLALQARSVARGHEDFPPELIRAQARGHVRGPWAWVRSRRGGR